MDNKNQFDDVFESDAEKKREKVKAHKETNFKEYLEMLQEDPSLAQNSSARILEIIATAGIEDIPDYERWTAGVDKRYKLFSSKLFGVEKSISELINYFKAGAFGLSTGRQICQRLQKCIMEETVPQIKLSKDKLLQQVTALFFKPSQGLFILSMWNLAFSRTVCQQKRTLIVL